MVVDRFPYVYMDLRVDEKPCERLILRLIHADDPGFASSFFTLDEQTIKNYDVSAIKEFHYETSFLQRRAAEKDSGEQDHQACFNGVKAFVWPSDLPKEHTFYIALTSMHFLNRCYHVYGHAIEGAQTLRSIHQSPATTRIEIFDCGQFSEEEKMPYKEAAEERDVNYKRYIDLSVIGNKYEKPSSSSSKRGVEDDVAI